MRRTARSRRAILLSSERSLVFFTSPFGNGREGVLRKNLVKVEVKVLV